MDPFSAKHRKTLIGQLQAGTFDVLVIGGGITGSGIALDAASRGLKVALVEMQDFAGGTSSRSTRLIHGGLRYLKQAEFRLVSEVAKERKIIHRNAPHLVKPELLLLPITSSGSFGKVMTRAAMWLYETLAGVKKEERHSFLGVSEATRMEPLLKRDGLLGAILYYEYRTDDARLTLSILREAVNRGAIAVSYLKVTGFVYDQGKVAGVKAEDQHSGKTCTIKSDYVINASGPWVDDLDIADNNQQGNKLQLTKGVHLVFDQKQLPLKQAVYFDAHDKRMVFALPHRGKTYVGTTDTFYSGDKINPPVTTEDKEYLLKCVNDYFGISALKVTDIESCWAGIRPLIRKPGKDPSEISRKDETFVWKSGLISIAGGKLTGYRKMAERVVDLVSKKMAASGKRKLPACNTATIPVSGGKLPTSLPQFKREKASHGSELGLTEQEAALLVSRYGSEIDRLFAIITDLKIKESAHELPLLLRAELIYAIDHEMCLTPSDFFARRTGMLYFEIDAVQKYNRGVDGYMKVILESDTEGVQF